MTDRKPRARSRKAAKTAGTSFETSILGPFVTYVNPDIVRQRLTGANDRGDLANVRLPACLGGHRVAIECKNERSVQLGTWGGETEKERVNLAAIAGFTVHKRHGKSDPLDQWVTGTLRDFIALLTGERPA